MIIIKTYKPKDKNSQIKYISKLSLDKFSLTTMKSKAMRFPDHDIAYLCVRATRAQFLDEGYQISYLEVSK